MVETHHQRYRPWHVVVTYVLLICYALLFLIAVVSNLWAWSQAFVPISIQKAGGLFLPFYLTDVFTTLVLFGWPVPMIWYCWVGPYCIVIDTRYVECHEVSVIRRGLAPRIWLPAAVASCYLGGVLYMVMTDPVHAGLGYVWPPLAFILTSGTWAFWWTRKVHRRLDVTLQADKICAH